MHKFYTIVFFFSALFTPNAFFAQNTKKKIAANVYVSLEHAQTVDCMLWMAEQADVSSAALLRTKEEKGQFVFEQLTQTAKRTQRNVLDFLQKEKITHQSFWVVNVIHAKLNQEQIEKIAVFPEISHIYFDEYLKGEEPVVSQNTDNEEDRTLEWGITKIEADKVWAGTAPLTAGANGAGVVIGGQDTGYAWEHPAIKSKYRGWNGTTADHNYNWHDCIDAIILPNTGTNPCGIPSTLPCDDGSHGTHTMGTMVGTDGANEIGVAPGAKWVGVRNMERGWGRLDTYVEGFEWFLAPTNSANGSPDASKAPHVINNSWGCPPPTPAPGEDCTVATFNTMETAVNNLRTAGVVVVVSAGNEGSACSTVQNPAAIFAGSFSVGATNSSDAIASFSSRGPVTIDGSNRLKPDVCAPGVAVRSCTATAPTGMPPQNPPTANYASFQGTSMAGPHVAGAVALMISAKPSLAGQVVTIENILKNTANHLLTAETCGGTNGVTPNNTFGHGRINVFAAVQSAVLPIELIGFYGKAGKEVVHLYWATENEINNDHFEIERSNDLISWEKIANINGAGNSITRHNYTTDDTRPMEGVNYYRLKQVDFDGKIEPFQIIAVEFKRFENQINLYPIPVQNILYFNIQTIFNGKHWLEIYDLQGRTVSKQSVFAENNAILSSAAVEDYSDGMYLVVLKSESGHFILSTKFLKK
jgi:subtilisin family serine protease